MLWHDVVIKTFWSLNLDDIKINGVPMNICEGKTNCLVTPDSGTTEMTMPSWAYEKFIDATAPQKEECESEF